MTDVLLVEDDALARERVRQLCLDYPDLQLNLRWECVNVPEAAAVLGDHPTEIGLMLIDSEMDGYRRQGVDFILTQRRMKFPLPPTILISSHHDLGDWANEAGVHYITKPFRDSWFVNVIRELLRLDKSETLHFFVHTGEKRVALRDIRVIRSDNAPGHDGVRVMTREDPNPGFLVQATPRAQAPMHTLKHYETTFGTTGLVRINMSTLVNLAWVDVVTYGETSLTLKKITPNQHDRSLDINPAYREGFKKAWKTWR